MWWFVTRFLVLGYVYILALGVGIVHADDDIPANPPPLPTSFQGVASLSDGSFVPEGFEISLRFGDRQSLRVDRFDNIRGLVGEDGKYSPLLAEPPDESYDGNEITFYLSRLGIEVQAEESYVLDTDLGFPKINKDFILTFPNLPPLPTPTPTPTPTFTPTPTSTPVPTSTPASDASVFSGNITVAGMNVPENAVLVAKIGEYESYPALIEGNEYSSLVVAPGDFSFLGEEIEFVLNGIKSNKVSTFESGTVVSGFNLIFEGLPTPTPVPTSTPSPTATPTITPIPTDTPVPTPSSTPMPIPTLVPTPMPTYTPVPVPTATAVPTPVQESFDIETPTPTPTPVPDGGFCLFSPNRPLSSGVGNLMFLFAPLGMAVGIRQYNRRNR